MDFHQFRLREACLYRSFTPPAPLPLRTSLSLSLPLGRSPDFSLLRSFSLFKALFHPLSPPTPPLQGRFLGLHRAGTPFPLPFLRLLLTDLPPSLVRRDLFFRASYTVSPTSLRFGLTVKDWGELPLPFAGAYYGWVHPLHLQLSCPPPTPLLSLLTYFKCYFHEKIAP